MAGSKKRKNSGNKGKKSDDKANSRKDENGVRGNESKQIKLAVKNDNKKKKDLRAVVSDEPVDQDNRVSRSRGASSRRTTVQIHKDDDDVLMEVDDTDFGEEEGELSAASSDSEIEFEGESENNNVTRHGAGEIDYPYEGSAVGDSEADTLEGEERIVASNARRQLVKPGCSDDEDGALNDKDIALFAKWEKYLERKRKQEEGNRRDKQEKFQKSGQNKPGRGKDVRTCDHEVIEGLYGSPTDTTVYEPAVKRSCKADRTKTNRNSSSSEYDSSELKDNEEEGEIVDELITQFAGAQRLEAFDDDRRFEGRSGHRGGDRGRARSPEPHCSRDEPSVDPIRRVEEETEARIKAAEKA